MARPAGAAVKKESSWWLLEIDPPQLLDARQRQPQPRPRRVYRHVAHHRPRRGDLDRLGALGGGIEGDDVVSARLVVPDAPVAADGDAVGLAALAAWAGVVALLAGGGVEPAQMPSRVVRIPHDAFGVDDQAARAGAGRREREDLQGAVRRIDAADLVGAEQRHPDHAVGRGDEAVWPGAARG